MAQHTVRVSLPERVVQRADVVFVVESDGDKFGELHVSQGGLSWWPRGAHVNRRDKRWEQFADWIEHV